MTGHICLYTWDFAPRCDHHILHSRWCHNRQASVFGSSEKVKKALKHLDNSEDVHQICRHGGHHLWNLHESKRILLWFHWFFHWLLLDNQVHTSPIRRLNISPLILSIAWTKRVSTELANSSPISSPNLNDHSTPFTYLFILFKERPVNAKDNNWLNRSIPYLEHNEYTCSSSCSIIDNHNSCMKLPNPSWM